MSTGGGGPGHGGRADVGGGEEEVGDGRVDPRSYHPGDPSSSRRRSVDAVWPEHFVEAVAVQVAVNACNSGGRLSAAPAIAVLFQVCSTWRNVSRSELLWQQTTRRVWGRGHTRLPSWRDEFVRRHLTAANFRRQRFTSSQLLPPQRSPALACSRIALSDVFLAVGFLDGSVRLFDLPDGRPLAAYLPDPHRERIGIFSRAVSGLVFLPDDFDPDRLVFSFQDGNIHVAPLDGDPISGVSRRARGGSFVEDGLLVDFTADHRWWVGLFAGVAGRSWQVWDAETEQLLYVGGTLTDADALSGWHLLTDADVEAIGRARFAAPEMVIGCTGSRLQVMYLTGAGGGGNNNDNHNNNIIIHFQIDVELTQGNEVRAMEACQGRAIVVDSQGAARVLRVPEMEEVCRFNLMQRPRQRPSRARTRQSPEVVVAGCMNWGYAIVWTGDGVARVWDASSGEYLCAIRERIGVATAMAAGDRYVVVWTNESGLHIWDFAPNM